MRFLIIALGGLAVVSCDDGSSSIINDLEQQTQQREQAQRWAYNDQVDEMRGLTTKVARVRANNWQLMAPELFVTKAPDKPTQVGIRGSVDEAAAPQMRCGGTVSIKFDAGPVHNVPCQDGMAVALDPKILPDLRKSKETWIEIETSIGSTQQYKFRTENLAL
jgi:hypothetical protein